MKKIICLLAFLSISSLQACGSCVDDDRVKSAVEKQGYSNVEIKSKGIVFISWRGCSDSDAAKYDITATNVKGDTVDLIVCAGWPFKGVTVRTK